MLGEDTATEIEKQVEAGKLSLADLNTLADKGKDISTGVLSLTFSTTNPQGVALVFLHCDNDDKEIDQKSARKGPLALLQHAFDAEISANVALVIAIYSALKKRAAVPGLLVLGDLSTPPTLPCNLSPRLPLDTPHYVTV
jgi:hypothetical protein